MSYKLIYAKASPYSCKVRMAAAYLGIALELVATETGKQEPILMNANPLAKIPVLLVPNGPAVYDSRAILRFLDRVSGGRLYPTEAAALTRVEVQESLCEGLLDSLLAHIYERRYRPEAIIHQPWLDKQWQRVLRVLQALEVSTLPAVDTPHADVIALRISLGYLALRFSGQWEQNVPGLLNWAETFDRRHPDLLSCLPA